MKPSISSLQKGNHMVGGFNYHEVIKAPFSNDATFQESQNFRFMKTCCANITS